MRVGKIAGNFTKVAIASEMFNSNEIEKILFLEKIMKFESGTVGSGMGSATENLEVRSCDVSMFIPDENAGWIFERIGNFIPQLNYDHFMLNINHLAPMQYTVYKDKNNGQYDWHTDVFTAYHIFERKITGVLFLSDPESYEGGELEVMNTGSPDRAVSFKQNAGDVVFFSSHFPHRVKPVTKGTRRTIVFWIEGEREF